MFQLNPLAIAGVLIAVTSAALILILLKYGSTRLHKIWIFFNLTVGLWGVGCIFVGTSTAENAIFNWKLAMAGFLIAPVFYHTTLVFVEKRLDYSALLGYLVGIVFIILNLIFLGNENFATVELKFGNLYWLTTKSIIFNIFMYIWILYVILGHLVLFKHYKTSTGTEKTRTFYFGTGMLIGFIGGSTNALLMLGIEVYPHYGNFTIPLYCAFATYAILKHKLTDITIVIKKGLIYSILLTLISLFYILFIFLTEQIFRITIGYSSSLISLLLVLISAAIFIPLRNKIQSIINKFFLKGNPIDIAEENILLRQEVAQTEKLKAVSTLASGLAHEVKNPLTAIRTFSEYLPQKLDDKEFLNKFSKIVGSEVSRVNDLVDQLLEFSKPSPPKLENTDICKLITETLNFLNSKFVENKINAKTDFASNPEILLKLDQNQIRQVLLNMFLNAIDAMPDRGTITTKINSSKEKVEITIADTGQGINKRDLSRIFDPFYSKKDGGTGLGLAITYSIIQNHGGTIKVESKVGEGTTFIIEIPIT